MSFSTFLLAFCVVGLADADADALIGDDETTTTLTASVERCCTLGRVWAEDKRDQCDDFPMPVKNVAMEYQTLCYSTMSLCCTAQRRQQQCEVGLQAAQAGRQCLRLSGVAGQAFQDCCLGCKLGLQVSSKTHDCRGLADDITLAEPWAEPFSRCCEEIHNGTFTQEVDEADEDDEEAWSPFGRSREKKCPTGFSYNSRLNVCDDVDECLNETHDCDDDLELCRNTIGGYLCEDYDDEDYGVGIGGDDACPKGFTFFLTSCIDEDECAEGTHSCADNEICRNKDGGYDCVERNDDDDDVAMIPSCPLGYVRNRTSGRCEDVNECQNGQHNCLGSQRCDNTLGSFTCVRYTTCGTGYTLNYDTGRCEDDDECSLGTDNCRQLGPGYLCLNIQGSFRCEKRKCQLGEILNEDGLCAPLLCQTGFEPGRSGSCVDVDECRMLEHACAVGQRCVNTMGSYKCHSQCDLGLELDRTGRKCQDLDECASGLAACFGGRRCVNTVGSYRCECPDGFSLSSTSGQCEDVDECAVHRHICGGIQSECQNSVGSYRCVCKAGFKQAAEEDDSTQQLSSRRGGNCVDIDECVEIASICQQRCTNMWGSYRCHCRAGFRLSSDQRSCIDVDECRDYDDICIGDCVNEPGSYKCTCPPGYTLSSNQHSCQDVDECIDDPCTGAGQHCFNTRGGYQCVDVSCPAGYVLEEGHNRRCRRKSGRCRSGDETCRRQPVSLSHNFIALISNLRVQQGVNLFTMQSARYRFLTTKFTLRVKSVNAAQNVEAADKDHFRLKTGSHSAVLSLVKSIQGPQDIRLELLMEMYHLGRYQASALANVYVFVTPHEF